MVDDNTSRFGTAFTVTIEAIGHGVTTGISAFDRATTIRLLCDEHAGPVDFAKTGHTFPLRGATGGALERAGLNCEIMREDGTMARRPDLDTFAADHNVHIVAISDLIAYRRRSERLVV